MSTVRLQFVVPMILGVLALAQAHAEEAPPTHDAVAHASSGIKNELIEGLAEADFLRLGAEARTVKLTLIAAYTPENYGMNFNGYSHGKAIYTVPKGWTVEVTFINPSPVPHSLVVVEREMVKKIQMGSPAFEGASVANPVQGISLKKVTFKFVAGEAGEYALACGFPTHALSGHWIAFNVRDGLKLPTLKLGEGEIKEAK